MKHAEKEHTTETHDIKKKPFFFAGKFFEPTYPQKMWRAIP
ncbi:hypothetical protein [Escherichia albertii]|nr:hypothetical protein [Escherichia albertii]